MSADDPKEVLLVDEIDYSVPPAEVDDDPSHLRLHFIDKVNGVDDQGHSWEGVRVDVFNAHDPSHCWEGTRLLRRGASASSVAAALRDLADNLERVEFETTPGVVGWDGNVH